MKRRGYNESRQALSYLIAGGATTAVNYGALWILIRLGAPENPANTAAVILSVVFAYLVNRIVVFRSSSRGMALIKEIASFFAARALSMAAEIGGVYFLGMYMNIFVAKAILNIVVIILNYLLSKFYIFKKGAGDSV